MKISLFGKNLFEISKSGSGNPTSAYLYNTASDTLAKSDYLIDFAKDTKFGIGEGSFGNQFLQDYALVEAGNGSWIAAPKVKKKEKGKKVEKKPEPKIELTPKGIHELKLLNDDAFKIKTDPTYIDEQLESFKEKLSMIKMKDFDMNNGTVEIASIISRLENRKKYAEFSSFYEEFPYTNTGKINEIIKAHSNLKIGEVSQFLADMPKDAVDVMKNYTSKTKELCGKKPIFYIIADKKDFQKSDKRRDPILLAQSPFGHFWQILGAWDEEMLFLDEL